MSFSGFYINMDKSIDRDAKMRSQLGVLSLADRYRRFSAIDGATWSGLSNRSNGEVGCFISHLRLLEQNVTGADHLHIMEDDTILSTRTAQVIERLTVTGGLLEEYDIIMTDAYLGCNLDMISYYRDIVVNSLAGDAHRMDREPRISVLDISGQPFACTSSYVANINSIPKIRGFLEAELSEGIRCPVDLLLRCLANNGHLRVGVTMPFITSVPINNDTASTINIHGDDLSASVSTLIRRALFLDCDAKAALAEAALCPGPASDDRDEVILAAVRLRLPYGAAGIGDIRNPEKH